MFFFSCKCTFDSEVWDQNPAKCIVATYQKISVIQKCKNTCKKYVAQTERKKMQIIRKAKNVVTDQNIISVYQKITSMNKSFKHIK